MSLKPRILVIGPTPPPHNGMSVVLENMLASPTLRQQFEMILLDTADRRGLVNVGRLDWQNITLALSHGFSFLWLLVSRQPDIVYVSIAQNTLGYLRDCLFLVPSRMLGKRVIVHLHGSDFQGFYRRSSGLMKLLIRWTLARVRRAVVLGEGLRGVFAGLVPSERVAVVPNGIEAIVLPSEKSGEQKKNVNGLQRVLYLGTLMKAKGFMEVLRSIPFALREEPGLRFILAGEPCFPEEIRAAEKYIEEQHLQAYIDLPGVVTGDQKQRLFHDADIFVFPPVAAEGQPLVILEAMAAGLPVIATPQGVISETIIDGETGFLVPAGDPAAIAEKILCLVQDKDLRLRMGHAGRERFLSAYHRERWAGDMAQLFAETLTEDLFQAA